MLLSDLPSLVGAVGLTGVGLIVFAESGLFVGFFLPGDSLLFTAGLLASRGLFSLWALVLVTFLCAVLGDSTGYTFGKYAGPRLFTREDSRFFHKRHLERARAFTERHGRYTIVLARFVPIVRTFAPILAGAGEMEYRAFLLSNILGGALWSVALPVLGFSLGNLIPDIDRYLLPIVGVIILLSILPAFFKRT